MRPAALIAVLGVLLAGCGDDEPALPADQGIVRRVVDGDTLVVSIGRRDEKVRLIGIDTPESVDPRRPVECLGKEAASRTAALVPPGTRVRLERDVEARDRYDRLLAYVYVVEDGRMLNLVLVEEGFAQPLTIPPNLAHTDQFADAARKARAAGHGLWSACAGPQAEPAATSGGTTTG